jgi:uncharacterized membrane protein YfcA
MTESTLLLASAVLAVAALYSSVGHGGASGYIAALSIAGFAKPEIASMALVLNLAVASISFLAYGQAKHFSWRLTWPFLLASVPMALLGAQIKVSDRFYFVLLGIALAGAAIRLLIEFKLTEKPIREPPIHVSIAVGGLVGLLSGVLGIGGGIFLSPIILLSGWARPKPVAATAAVFIVANSLAGLTGRLFGDGVHLPSVAPLLLPAGVVGAVIGAWFGAQRAPSVVVRRLLGAVLLIASIKMLIPGAP